MTATVTNPLVEALNLSAPNGEEWIRGFDAFTSVIKDGASFEEAYYAALDASAPDEESWLTARDRLVIRGQLDVANDRKPWLDRTASKVKRNILDAIKPKKNKKGGA